MCKKKSTMKNALTATMFASLLVFSAISSVAQAGSPADPGEKNSQRPDIPPGLEMQGKENPPNRPDNPPQDKNDKKDKKDKE